MTKIYLDHAATTQLDKKVAEKIHPYMLDIFGNPSSLHSFGQEAIKGVDWAREEVAKLFKAKTKEIIFTAGATESNNIAIQGLLRNFRQRYPKKKFHLITTNIEHPAVLDVYTNLEKDGLAEITIVKVKKNGIVDVKDVEKAIQDNTILVSVMYVNNEIGTIQPIREIGKMIEKVNKERAGKAQSNTSAKLHPSHKAMAGTSGMTLGKVYFHTDATQAALYCKMFQEYLKVDLVSISGHKIYGPKGIGALFIKEGTPIKPISFGGHQEGNIRPGTHNVPAIVGLGAAVELINNGTREKENEKIKKLRDRLITKLEKEIKNTQINGDMENRVVSNLNISFKNAEGESILLMLDMEGIAVSTGSACASGSLDPSHVLLALGLPHEDCHAAIRFSLGKDNTEKEIDTVIKVLKPIVQRLRKMSPLK